MVYISTHQSFRKGFSWQLESYYKPVYSDTASTQNLPTASSNTLGLGIYCSLGFILPRWFQCILHLNRAKYKVALMTDHHVSVSWLNNMPPITQAMPGKWTQKCSHISVASSEPQDQYLWNQSIFPYCPGYHIHLQDKLLWQLNLGLVDEGIAVQVSVYFASNMAAVWLSM